MTIMGPGDDFLLRLADGADGGSEVCFQEVVLHMHRSSERRKENCEHHTVQKAWPLNRFVFG